MRLHSLADSSNTQIDRFRFGIGTGFLFVLFLVLTSSQAVGSDLSDAIKIEACRTFAADSTLIWDNQCMAKLQKRAEHYLIGSNPFMQKWELSSGLASLYKSVGDTQNYDRVARLANIYDKSYSMSGSQRVDYFASLGAPFKVDEEYAAKEAKQTAKAATGPGATQNTLAIISGAAAGATGRWPDGTPISSPAPHSSPAPQSYPQPQNSPQGGAQLVAGLQCTRWDYTESDGAYYVTNSCGVPVNVKFTSQTGNAWGEGTIGAGQRQALSMFGMGGNPKTNGEIWLYTCPVNTTAVMPDGQVFWSRTYHGSYLCH